MNSLQIWEVEMFRNTGTIEKPVMEWVKDRRYYESSKTKEDFDLHDIPGLRRNAKQITSNE